jgi:hypothetical protein
VCQGCAGRMGPHTGLVRPCNSFKRADRSAAFMALPGRPPTSWVLFICAKNLLLEAMASTGPGNFEPGARTRRPTVVGAALKMSASSMSDEFDSLDATEKAAVEAALNRCRTLAAKIESDLRKKRPEHFVDKLSLADFCASLARCRCPRRGEGFAGAGASVIIEGDFVSPRSQGHGAAFLSAEAANSRYN